MDGINWMISQKNHDILKFFSNSPTQKIFQEKCFWKFWKIVKEAMSFRKISIKNISLNC